MTRNLFAPESPETLFIENPSGLNARLDVRTDRQKLDVRYWLNDTNRPAKVSIDQPHVPALADWLIEASGLMVPARQPLPGDSQPLVHAETGEADVVIYNRILPADPEPRPVGRIALQDGAAEIHWLGDTHIAGAFQLDATTTKQLGNWISRHY